LSLDCLKQHSTRRFLFFELEIPAETEFDRNGRLTDHGRLSVEILLWSFIHRVQGEPVPRAHPGLHILEHHEYQVSARGGRAPSVTSKLTLFHCLLEQHSESG